MFSVSYRLRLLIFSALTSTAAAQSAIPSSVADTAARFLAVESIPDGAVVVIDGVRVGTTPYSSTDITYGTHIVHLVREGFGETDDSIHIRFREPVRVRRRLLYLGSIIVTSTPDGSHVFLADTLVGITPLALHNMPAGRVDVRLSNPEYSEFRSKIVIPESSTVELNVKLVAAYGKLNMVMNAVDAFTLLDDDTLGRGSFSEINVPVGRHELIVRSAVTGMESSTTIFISPHGRVDANASVDVFLWRPVLYNLVAPGLGQTMFGHSGRGTIVLGTFAAAAAGALVSTIVFEAHRRDYMTTRSAYLIETANEDLIVVLRNRMISEREKADAARSAAYVFGGVAGAVYVYALLDALLFNNTFTEISASMTIPRLSAVATPDALHLTLHVPLGGGR